MGTTNIELMQLVEKLKIPNFRGIFMRDELIKLNPLKQECAILNLDSSNNEGTHWNCWIKDGDNKYYFDSFGAPPPLEIVKYLKSPILYNTYQIQQFNETNCGEWCIYVLKEYYNNKKDFIDVILNIINNYKLY